jgi:hypothetical protein
MESAIAAWFKQAHESNASINENHLKETALHITVHLEIANFSSPNEWINRFKERHNNVYRKLSCNSMSVDPETVED